MTEAKTVFRNGHLLTLDPDTEDFGLIEDGVLVAGVNGDIVWLGSRSEFDRRMESGWESVDVIDLAGRFISPGLVDCHTHLIFGGSRADEWQQRLEGVSYEQIARQGGGIRSTVAATRAASEKQLVDAGNKRAAHMLTQGVTTVEVKSGYGLDPETELKMLQAAKQVADDTPQDYSLTFLGAHSIPSEFDGDADGYLDCVIEKMLPRCAPLVEAVDVFCEKIAFNLGQTERVFEGAAKFGLPVKIHAEQLSNLGGAKLAAERKAWSADHLEYLDEPGVRALAENETVAVLLPGAYYFINETQKPPVDQMRDYGVPMAVASDFNPGSSPVFSLPLMMNFACTLFGLTPVEAFRGITIHAAQALRRDDRIGSLSVGKQADLAIWDIESAADLAYGIGHQPCCQVYKRGKLVFEKTA